MNERIKELAEQAVNETQLMMIMEYKDFESKLYEKFAELIVKECMTICEDVAERNDPAIACYYEIKRTFRS
jgi:hypothetical protein